MGESAAPGVVVDQVMGSAGGVARSKEGIYQKQGWKRQGGERD